MDINRAANEASQRISAAFTRSGLSKKKLSEDSGIPYATLDRRFRNGGGYTLREVYALAAALDVPTSQFIVDDKVSP
ncbi:helix-turn-helix domain-containing protein [Microbacterium karelineae]|uniref:helix-turn-helix domain-containing protein n=1 Tax=Microbacterium karelineae TaxID=2654283 RepID=UPI0012EA3E7D|nr:helix-turn-helix transcriptional regulator [Microbacterium karelineae]